MLAPFAEVTAQVETGSRDFVAWAKERAIELDSLAPGASDPAAFAFLDEALKGKRIVFLGESDHFVAERMEFRLLLIRELARRGYRRIGMEMGLSDGRRIDHYLETGDASWLDKVALYGYRGNLRTDRVDQVPGWTDDANPEFTKVVLDEAEWFVRQLRAINEGMPVGVPRLSWFGFDLSFRPGGGYEDAGEILAPHGSDALVVEIERRMRRTAGETRLEEASRLESLTEFLDERREDLATLVGEAGALSVRRSLQRMADAFRFIESMQGLPTFDAEQIAAALRKREVGMMRNFDEHLTEWPADEKIILLGHMLHLSKDSEAIVTASYGKMWTTVGTHLERRLPGETYGFWLLHRRGTHGVARARPPVQPFLSPRGSIEHMLAAVHPLLMLPLSSKDPRAAWLDEERLFSRGGQPCRAVLPRQTDCLFFLEEAHEPGRRVAR